jgi:hypothetical protein
VESIRLTMPEFYSTLVDWVHNYQF